MLLQHDAATGPGGSETSDASRPGVSSPAIPAASPLARCVDVDRATFAEQVWGRRPLLTRKRAGTGFADLFSLQAVDELVSRRGLRTPFLRMARNGTVLPESSYTRAGGSGATITDQASDEKILAQLAAGATLVLQALHRTWPPLLEFGSALAAELGHPVQINSYVTPAQNQGFSAHYDTHDVFVLQIAGRKRWIIHEPVLVSPLPDQPWDQRKAAVAEQAATTPLLDEVLEPGDALYLPRGYLHSAKALGELSVHLTVGVHPVTGYQLVEALVAGLRDDPQVRASLPVGVGLADPAVLAESFRLVADRLTAAAGDAVDRLPAAAAHLDATLHRTTRPAPLAPLAQLAALTELGPDTRVSARSGLHVTRRDGAGGVSVTALDKTVALPPMMAEAVGRLLSGRSVSASELPGLDSDEQLVLTRRFLREGFVVPSAGPGPDQDAKPAEGSGPTGPLGPG